MFSAELFRALSIQNALFKTQSVLLTCKLHIHYRGSSGSFFLSMFQHLHLLILIFFGKKVELRISSPLQAANLKHISAGQIASSTLQDDKTPSAVLSKSLNNNGNNSFAHLRPSAGLEHLETTSIGSRAEAKAHVQCGTSLYLAHC